MANESLDKQAEDVVLSGLLYANGSRQDADISTVRSARLARGVTLRELSELTGISFPVLSEIERGVKMPTPEQEEALETFFDAVVRYRLIPFIEKVHRKE